MILVWHIFLSNLLAIVSLLVMASIPFSLGFWLGLRRGRRTHCYWHSSVKDTHSWP